MFAAGAWMCIPAIKGAFAGTYGAQNMAEFGSLMQFVSYGAFVGAIIAAPLAQKASVKVAFVVAGLICIIGVAVVALSGTAISILLAGRFITGIAIGLIAVTSITAVGVWFPIKTRGVAMSVWAVWVPVGMLIFQNSANPLINVLGGPTAEGHGFNNLFWVFAVLMALATVFIIVVYREPRADEASATVSRKIPLRDALPHLAKPALIPVAITWLVFNAVNQVNTTYNVVFLQAGYGMATEIATLLGSIASAAGIAAIIFGFISDRLQVPKKYILIVISSCALTLAMVLGFKPVDISTTLGMVQFVGYLIFMFIGNAGLVACVRPYVPLLVGRGGAVAIGYALMGVTLLQYIGQMFSQPFGGIIDGMTGGAAAMAVSRGVAAVDPAVLGAAFGQASWILVGIGAVGFIASFFLRVKAPKKDGESKDK
jgi:MFS family permease